MLSLCRHALKWKAGVNTFHFALDAGPIVLQAAVPALDNDTAETLAARILKEEHRIYSEAIGIVLSGRWRIEGRRVIR
jgi:phosphoribosylglycinamide formyltransferase-1